MAELGTAYLTILPSLQGGIRSLERELRGMNLNSAGTKTGGSFMGGFNGGCRKLAKVGIGAIAGIGTAIGGLAIGGGISRAMKLDQAEMKFKAMGVNVEAAMKSCNEAVTGTAFGLDAAATVASQLAASGVQAGSGMTSALKGVAGMASMAGVSMERVGIVFGKVAAQGRLQGDELMQFSEMGVNATAALAKHLNKSQAEVREMVSAGLIDFQTFSDAMYETFGEAAQGANETFAGAMANVQAALSRIGAKFASPALESLRKIFVAMIPAVDQLSAKLDPLVERFTAFVEAFATKATESITAFVDTLNNGGSVLDAFGAAFDALPLKVRALISVLKTVVIAATSLYVFTEVTAKVKAAIAAFNTLKTTCLQLGPQIHALGTKLLTTGAKMPIVGAMSKTLTAELYMLKGAFIASGGGGKGLVTVLKMVGSAMLTALMSPIGIVIGAIAALAAAFIYMWNTSEPFKQQMIAIGQNIMASLKPALDTIMGALNQLIQSILPVFTTLIQTLVPILTTIIGVVTQIAAVVFPILAQIVATVVPVIATIISVIAQLVSQIVSLLMPIIQAILGLIQKVMPVIQTIVTSVMSVIMGVIQAVWPAIEAIISAVMTVIQTIIDTVWPAIEGVVTTVMSGIKAVIDAIWPAIQFVIETVLGAIQTIITVITSIIKGDWEGAWQAIKDFFCGIWDSIKTFFSEIWTKIKEGLKKGLDSVVQWFKDIPQKIKDFFLGAGEWLLDAGKEIINGLFDGIKNAFADGFSWFQDNVGGAFTEGICNAYGINSPSKVMRDEVGRWIPAGITVGIERNLGPLMNTAEMMKDATLNAMPSPNDLIVDGGDFSASKSYDFSNNSTAVDEVLSVLYDYLPSMAAQKNVVMDSGALVGAIESKMDIALGVREKRRSKGL